MIGTRTRTATRPRRRAAARRRHGQRLALRRPGPRLIAGLIGGLIVLGGLYLWLRDSSLVGVSNVRIVGANGPDASQIRAALRQAARNETTLDVSMRPLQTAVAPFPVVKSIDVITHFPHAMTIRVDEQVPVAIITAAGHRIPVAGDGTLLHDVKPTGGLPTISLSVVPGGNRLSGTTLSEVRLLAAAPYAMLAKLSGVSEQAGHGLSAELRNGPSLYFGTGSQLGAKWTAVTEVLANSGSSGAQYIDVTDPSRPAAGAGSDTSSTSGSTGG